MPRQPGQKYILQPNKEKIKELNKLNKLTEEKDLHKTIKKGLVGVGTYYGGIAGGGIFTGASSAVATALGITFLATPIGQIATILVGTGIGAYSVYKAINTKFKKPSAKYKQQQLKAFKSIAGFFKKNTKSKFCDVCSEDQNKIRIDFPPQKKTEKNKRIWGIKALGDLKGNSRVKEYTLKNWTGNQKDEIHYAVMYKEAGKEKPLFQWRETKRGNKIILFMFKRAIIYMGGEFGSDQEFLSDKFPEPIEFDTEKTQIILPISINKYPQMEKDSLAIQTNLQKAVEKKIKNAKNKLAAVSAFKKKGKGSNPVFDPFPFATQIKQKEHKIYKNLRY